MTQLFLPGPIKSHNGLGLPDKIDCDALSESDWHVVAQWFSKRVAPYGKVIGIPKGGLSLAHFMGLYATKGCDTLLIVDDVLTTGKSMEQAKADWGHGKEVIGAVLFARTGEVPEWITARFQEMWP